MVAEFLLAFVALYFISKYVKFKYSTRLLERVPGPSGYPIVGLLPFIPIELDGKG